MHYLPGYADGASGPAVVGSQAGARSKKTTPMTDLVGALEPFRIKKKL